MPIRIGIIRNYSMFVDVKLSTLGAFSPTKLRMVNELTRRFHEVATRQKRSVPFPRNEYSNAEPRHVLEYISSNRIIEPFPQKPPYRACMPPIGNSVGFD